MGFFARLFHKKKKNSEIEPTREAVLDTEDTALLEEPKDDAREAVPECVSEESAPVDETVAEERAPADEAVAEQPSAIPEESITIEIVEETDPTEKEETKSTARPSSRRAKFEIKRTKDDRFVFNLYAANQVIVATSQIYSSSQSALNGIKSIIANAERAAIEDQTLKDWTPQGFPKWEIYLDNAKQYRFRLDAPNGSCIVHSQGYTSKASCKNGIESIIRNAKDALVDKAYLVKKDTDK